MKIFNVGKQRIQILHSMINRKTTAKWRMDWNTFRMIGCISFRNNELCNLVIDPKKQKLSPMIEIIHSKYLNQKVLKLRKFFALKFDLDFR